MGTDFDMMNVIVEDDAEDIMATVQEEVGQQAQERAKRKLKEGIIPPFYMPKNADDDGERIATVRFLTPLNGPDGGTKVIEHHRFKGVRTVCPATFGRPCQLCVALLEKSGLSKRADLYASAQSMAQYANPKWSKADIEAKRDFKTEWVYIWTLWHREFEAFGEDEPGGQVIAGWYHNDNSPVDAIFSLNQDMLHPDDSDRKPAEIWTYDIKITQKGEQTKKKFFLREKAVRPFNQEDRVKKLTKADLKFFYAISIAYTDPEWQEWLMKAWKYTQENSKPQIPEKTQKVNIELPD